MRSLDSQDQGRRDVARPEYSNLRSTDTVGAAHWAAWLMRNRLYRASAAVMRARPNLTNGLLIGLPCLWILSWNVLPLVEMLRISFLREFPVRLAEDQSVTLEHYRDLLVDPTIYGPFIRTMAFGLALVVGTFATMLPIAYFIAKRVPPAWQLRLLIIVLIPSWVSEIIRVFSYALLLASNGAINILLTAVGLTQAPIPFLYSWFSLSAGVLYVSALFMLVPLYAAIDRIPVGLLEAASDLGASKFQRFTKVTLPLIRDGVATGAVLVFLMATGIYTVPAVLAGPGNNMFAQVIADNFMDSSSAWPRASAYSMALLGVSLVIAGVLNHAIRRFGRPRP